MFEEVDLFFGKAFSEDEDVIVFLAYLFKQAREGHLSTVIDESLDFSNEEILRGSKKVPLDVVEEGFVQNGNRWYLKRNYECEVRISTNIERIKKGVSDSIKFENNHGLNEEQKQCVMHALKSPLTFICGGPGTGKTRTASALISHFEGKKVAVTAPTGKATANLRKMLIPNERWLVTTLQGLLKTKKESLPFDLIVVDEGSMVDAFLMHDLVSSIGEGTKLVILGDVNQLPPVGVGTIFADLVEREKEHVTFLTKCLRSELKEILELSKKVNERELFPLSPLPNQKELIDELSKRLILPADLESYFLLYKSFRILTPQRKGPYGFETLNQALYKRHKMKGGSLVPIIITKNDYELDLQNGDFAMLDETKKMAFFEDGRHLKEVLLPPFEYSYVLSIHKSQGSEYDEVIVLLPNGSENFGKELVYTAVTRAKKKVTVFGSEPVLLEIYKKGLKSDQLNC